MRRVRVYNTRAPDDGGGGFGESREWVGLQPVPAAKQVLYLETRQQKGTHLLLLPARQNFLCSGPGQRGGGSVKEDEGGERKGEGVRDGAGIGGQGRGPANQE